MKSELSRLHGLILLALPLIPFWKLATGGHTLRLPPIIYETYPWWQTIYYHLVLLLRRNRGPRSVVALLFKTVFKPGLASWVVFN